MILRLWDDNDYFGFQDSGSSSIRRDEWVVTALYLKVKPKLCQIKEGRAASF